MRVALAGSRARVPDAARYRRGVHIPLAAALPDGGYRGRRKASLVPGLAAEDSRKRESLAEDALRLRMTNASTMLADRMRVEYGGGEAVPRRLHDTSLPSTVQKRLNRAFNDGLLKTPRLPVRC